MRLWPDARRELVQKLRRTQARRSSLRTLSYCSLRINALRYKFWYTNFCTDSCKKVKEKHPDFSAGQISKELGEMWRALSAEDKQVYETKSDEDKQRYKNELAEYQAKVTAMATEE